jgi:sucrose phosphorylase
MEMIGAPANAAPPSGLPLSERDVILIAYADQVRRAGEPPLASLGQFLRKTIAGTINTIHILPFYPYSSDDGFSVIDYYAVKPGSEREYVRALHRDFGSCSMRYSITYRHRVTGFRRFCAEAPYEDFITVDRPPTCRWSAVAHPAAADAV